MYDKHGDFQSLGTRLTTKKKKNFAVVLCPHAIRGLRFCYSMCLSEHGLEVEEASGPVVAEGWL